MTREPAPASGPTARTEGSLTVTDFVRHQGAAVDMNPLHRDPDYAAAAGYPTVFAVGMRQAGVVGSMLAAWAGPENVRELDLQFRAQAWPGDTLTYEAIVRGRRAHGSEDLVDLDIRVTTSRGLVHIQGSATCIAPG